MLDLFLGLFGLLAVLGAAGTVLSRHPIHAAMSLVGTFLSVASLYALMQAHLLAAIQVIVYVGAIMVLIVYTILLMDLRDEDLGPRLGRGRAFAGVLGLVWLMIIVARAARLPIGDTAAVAADFGTIEAVARELFTTHVYAFELVSVLLLAAIVASLVLATQGRARAREAQP